MAKMPLPHPRSSTRSPGRETARRITGKEIKAVVEPRRGGDPSVLIASNKKAAEVLGWKPVLGLDQIVSDAWAWHSGHPNGYEG